MVIDREKAQLEKLTIDYVEMLIRIAQDRKRLPAKSGHSGEAAEIAAMERILNRLADEIQIRKVNLNAPARIEIRHRAG